MQFLPLFLVLCSHFPCSPGSQGQWFELVGGRCVRAGVTNFQALYFFRRNIMLRGVSFTQLTPVISSSTLPALLPPPKIPNFTISWPLQLRLPPAFTSLTTSLVYKYQVQQSTFHWFFYYLCQEVGINAHKKSPTLLEELWYCPSRYYQGG